MAMDLITALQATVARTLRAEATALCSIYGDVGTLKCGMNLCCSHYGWCGSDEIHCGDPDPHDLALLHLC